MLSIYHDAAMRLTAVLFLGVLLSAVQIGPSAGQGASMPPGSFLRTPVSSMKDLNRELRTDKLVVARYSRLLRLTPDMVRATFAQLHLTHLQKDMMLEVHYVHARETIGAKLRRVRKGTAVFALSDGTPVLVQVCGNPLRSILNTKKIISVHPTEVRGVAKYAQMGDMEETPDFDPEEPLNTPVHTVASRTINLREGVPTVEVFPADKDTLAADEMPANAMEPGEVIPVQTLAQAQHSLASWVHGIVPAAIAAAGVASAITVAASSTSPVKTQPRPVPTKPTHTKPIANTPEPSSILFATACAATMLAAAALRRRKSQ